MSPATQYLARHAEPEAKLAGQIEGKWENSVVIPCLGEGARVLDSLRALAKSAEHCGSRALAIVVVNEAPHATDDHRQENQVTEDVLKGAGLSVQKTSPRSQFGRFEKALDVFALYRTNQSPLPQKQGVGLARKIGCDIACALIHSGKVNQPHVRTTDADAHVGKDYLTPIEEEGAGFFFPFLHEASGHPVTDTAIRQYDEFLRYYVRGLKFAGSPYSFPTIGSTLAFHWEAYCAVRGFPKRLAAEDFHFLNKLAKLGPIVALTRTPIRLTHRDSDRVPFGTGAAVHRIRAEGRYDILAPQTFTVLQQWLGLLEKWTETRPENLQLELEAVFSQHSRTLYKILNDLHTFEAIDVAWRTRKTRVDRRVHLTHWFDGLKTMRFLHSVRDALHPSLPVEECNPQACFTETTF